MITILLIEVSRLILTGICLGIGFLLVRMLEDWLAGRNIMANKELMDALAKA